MPYDKNGKYYRQPVYNKSFSSTSQAKNSSEKRKTNAENQAENSFKQTTPPTSIKKHWKKLSYFQKLICFTMGGLIMFGILSSLFSSFQKQFTRTKVKPIYVIPKSQNTFNEQLMLQNRRNVGDILKSNPVYK